MPDGDIQLSVTLKADDVRNKAESLRDSIRRMFEVGASQGLDNSLLKILNQMEKLSAKSAKLEAELGMLDQQSLNGLTQAMQELETEINRIQSGLSAMPQTMQNADVVARETAKLKDLTTQYEMLKQEKETIMAQGLSGMGVEGYDETVSKINDLNNQLVILKARLDEARGTNTNIGGNIADSSDRATGSVSRFGEAVRSAFSSMNSQIGSSEKQINQFASSVGGKLVGALNKVKTATERAFSAKNIKRSLVTLIKYTVGVRSLYFLFRKLRNAVKEGLQNLVQYHSSTNETNKAMTELRSSLLFLKNAWASAFAPIINFVMPALTMLIDGIAEVGNAIARFIGALTGQSKVLNAVKVNAGDYAKSLDKVGGSAKKAKDRLASFDDLNVLGRDSDAGGGGGASSLTPDPNEMFEYVDAVSDLAEMLKRAWDRADFTEVGLTLRDKLISALRGINWGEVQAEAERIGKSAGTFLAGLFGDPQLFIEGGKAIAEGFNTITTAIKAFLDETSGVDFGGNFAQGVNEFLQVTNWQQAGANINEAFTQINDNIQSFLNTLNESDIASAISDFIAGLDIPKMLAETGQTVITLTVKGIKVFASTIAELGRQLGEDLVVYVTKDRFIKFTDEGEEIVVPYTPKFDWKENPLLALSDAMLFDLGQIAVDAMGLEITPENIGALTEAFKPLNDFANGTLLGGTGGGLGVIFDTSKWSEDAKNVVATLSAISEILNGIVGFNPFFLVSGFQKLNETTGFFQSVLQGVYDIFYNIGAIAMTVLDPVYQLGQGIGMLIDNFTKAGGVGAIFEGLGEFGGNLIGGILDGAKVATEGIGQWVSDNIVEPFMTADTSTFETLGTNIIEGIKTGAEAVITGIGQWVSDNVVSPIVDAFCELLGIQSPSTVFAEYGVDIIQGLLDGMNSMIESVIQIFIDLKDSLAQKWEDIRISASEKWRAIKEGITGKVIELKDSVVSKFVEIKDNIIGKILMLKDNAIQKFMEIRAGIYNAFSTLSTLIKTPINAVLGVVESFVNKVIKGINKLIGSFDGIGDLASQVGLTVPELKIPEISIPRLAQGAVIPPNKEFMAVLGDQSHGTNIEAPLDTIKQAVAEVMGANGNQEVVQLLQQLITVVENKNLTIGDKEIGKANARYTNQQRMIRGTSF